MNIFNDISSNTFLYEPTQYIGLNTLTSLFTDTNIDANTNTIIDTNTNTNTPTLDSYFERLLERSIISNILIQDQYQYQDQYQDQNQDQSIDGIINNSFNEDDARYKHVLSNVGRQSLKTIQYRRGVCNNDHCPITQEKFKSRQKVTILPCKHGFNPESIDEWLEKQRAECPMCRLKLDSVEIKNEDYVETPNIQDSRNSFLNSLNILNSMSHPFGRNQIHNTIPHSYLNNNIIISEEDDLAQSILNSLVDISGQSIN